MKIILLVIIAVLAGLYYDLAKCQSKEEKMMAEEARKEQEEKWSTL